MVAHDWGGAVAWSFAAQYPGYLRRLIMINAPHAITFARELRDNPAQQRASAYMNLFRNEKALHGKPVWLFSSGPIGTSRTNAKGEDLLDVSVSGPKEIDELREAAKSRDHRIFFGALEGSKLTGTTGFMYRIARRSEEARKSLAEGDFRNWNEIGAWADSIAGDLRVAPAA